LNLSHININNKNSKHTNKQLFDGLDLAGKFVIEEGETLNEYDKRVSLEKEKIIERINKSGSRKKRNEKRQSLQQRKKFAKKRKWKELEEELGEFDFHHLRDKVNFGEVVEQPPKLEVIPPKPKKAHYTSSYQASKS